MSLPGAVIATSRALLGGPDARCRSWLQQQGGVGSLDRLEGLKGHLGTAGVACLLAVGVRLTWIP